MRQRDRLIGFKATERERWLLDQLRQGVGQKESRSDAIRWLIEEEARRRGLKYKPPGLVEGPTFHFDMPIKPAELPELPELPELAKPPADPVADSAAELVNTLAGIGQKAKAQKKGKAKEVKTSLPSAARKSNPAPAGSSAGSSAKRNSGKKPSSKKKAR